MTDNIDVTKLIKAQVHPIIHEQDFLEYWAYSARPAKGLLYITHGNHEFISGHCRMRARPNGAYPYHYIEMIDNLFGPDEETIEVCSGQFSDDHVYTVDINPDNHPSYVGDAQDLAQLPPGAFTRWRADPPYNAATALSMYNCALPNFNSLLREGMRVVKPNSLLFLLLGPTNFQIHPKGLKRIGIIFITLVPNNEVRCLNIYLKL